MTRLSFHEERVDFPGSFPADFWFYLIDQNSVTFLPLAEQGAGELGAHLASAVGGDREAPGVTAASANSWLLCRKGTWLRVQNSPGAHGKALGR